MTPIQVSDHPFRKDRLEDGGILQLFSLVCVSGGDA